MAAQTTKDGVRMRKCDKRNKRQEPLFGQIYYEKVKTL
jgi:hypothetical protein